jgi:catechol 1,2-dioxygenase
LTYGYLPNAPLTTTLAPPDLPGRRMVISGFVYGADCATPLPDVLIEVWHADSNGVYHNTAPYILRGQFRTDEEGRYRFSTIKPGYHKTRHMLLPALIHYRLSYQGKRVLSTQLVFAGDPFLTEHWTVFPDTIIPLTEQIESDGSILQGTFDVTVPVDLE